MADDTRGMLREWGVRVVEVTNDIDPNYPIGNKVSCMRVATDADRIVFVDSDVVLVRDFVDVSRLSGAFAAKPADLAHAIGMLQWRRMYAACGAKSPEGRVVSTLFGQTLLPYFNAGFIAADRRANLGDAWLACCRRINAMWGVRFKHPHLDQMALPVAVQKLGLEYDCLDERYNYPAHLKAIDRQAAPLFVHYHGPHVLRREPSLCDLASQLCGDHPALAARLAADPEYAPLTLDAASTHTAGRSARINGWRQPVGSGLASAGQGAIGRAQRN